MTTTTTTAQQKTTIRAWYAQAYPGEACDAIPEGITFEDMDQLTRGEILHHETSKALADMLCYAGDTILGRIGQEYRNRTERRACAARALDKVCEAMRDLEIAMNELYAYDDMEETFRTIEQAYNTARKARPALRTNSREVA